MSKSPQTVRVFNVHSAHVAGVPPQEEGHVAPWVAAQFADSYLRPLDKAEAEDAPPPPPPPAEEEEKVHHRTAVRLIKEATEYAQVEPFLEDDRPSVKAAAEERVQELES